MKRLFSKAVKSAIATRDFVDTEFRLALGLSVQRSATPRQSLEQWLSALGTPPPSKGRILITALRNETWIEWAVYCACVIRGLGYESTLVYWRPEIERFYPVRSRTGNFWNQASRIPGVELIDLARIELGREHIHCWEKEAQEWACPAVAYENHIEEHDVRSAPWLYKEKLERMKERITRLSGALATFLETRSFDRCLCSSGLIGESKVLLSVLRAAGVETVCLEGWAWRPGHMIYNLNAPALEYNVQGWIESFGPWDSVKENEVNAYLKFLDGGKQDDAEWLDNFYRIQRDSISATLPSKLLKFLKGGQPIYLLAPNVIGDSSMLRRETIFPGQQFWTREMIQWFAVRPHLKLVIRAHPAERWIGSKCAVYMGEVSRQAAAGLANIFVIDSAEDVNTFSLIPFARLGLVWLSSAGVDFVVRGLPAIAAARPKYTGMGIVEEPVTRDGYFSLLERHALEAQRPSLTQIIQGKRYLHVVFKGFSFEACGRNYRATGCRLGHMASQSEHDRFYRILVGDESMPDVKA